MTNSEGTCWMTRAQWFGGEGGCGHGQPQVVNSGCMSSARIFGNTTADSTASTREPGFNGNALGVMTRRHSSAQSSRCRVARSQATFCGDTSVLIPPRISTRRSRHKSRWAVLVVRNAHAHNAARLSWRLDLGSSLSRRPSLSIVHALPCS